MPWFVNESSLRRTPYLDYPCLDQSRPSLSPAHRPPSDRLSYCVEGVVEQGLITPDSLPLVDARSCLHMLIVKEKKMSRDMRFPTMWHFDMCRLR